MRILSLLSLLILAACGFSPMYGNMNDNALGTEDFLSYVAIDNIPDRDGVYLRNALIDRFHRNGSPVRNAYTLRVINMRSEERRVGTRSAATWISPRARTQPVRS